VCSSDLAHFHDPYAKTLAGERGEEIVRKMPWAKSSAWAMIVRTCVIDELTLKSIREHGVTTVLNLAAGLDTRPYRLSLPPELHWVEADFPPMIQYKEEKLKDHKPVCRLERIPVDLSNVSARSALFDKIDSENGKVLIITEGLLVYLTTEQVASFATDLASRKSFHFWVSDIATPVLLEWLNKRFGKTLATAGVKMQFAPEEGADFFAPFGWEIAEFRPTQQEAQRLKRQMPFRFLWRMLGVFAPKRTKEGFKKVGMVLMRRSGT